MAVSDFLLLDWWYNILYSPIWNVALLRYVWEVPEKKLSFFLEVFKITFQTELTPTVAFKPLWLLRLDR